MERDFLKGHHGFHLLDALKGVFQFFCDNSKLLHSPFNYKYLQAVLWQPPNAQQEVKSQVCSKTPSLCWCKVDSHAGYGEDVVAEGPTVSTLAGSALACSWECGQVSE